MFERYAVYYTPTGELAEVGASWLGWDSLAGQEVLHPLIDRLDVAALTETPRKYGIHGTLKPPFYLANGTDAGGLSKAVETLAASLAPVTLDGLEVRRLGGFLALVPRGDQAALAALAAKIVMDLDVFRAPPSEAELARRRQGNLSDAQEKHLNDWGYPYVMDQFRFHITLTGRQKNADALLPKVTDHFTPVLPRPFVVDALTLLGQRADGRFEQIARCPCEG
jgi:putative phosphonate metabolism protein